MNKGSVLKHSLFYFQTKAIKFTLQLFSYLFFFAIITKSLPNGQTVVLPGMYQENQEIS
jgi:hypothetical protein